MIFLEKVCTFRSLGYCAIDFQRSIPVALNEIICLPVFVLACGLLKFYWVAYLVLLYIQLSNSFCGWPKAYSEFSKSAPVTS